MSQSPMGYKISPVLQEHLCRFGSKLPFEEASQELSKLLRLDINAKQVERLCHSYGQRLDEIDWDEAYSDGIQLKINYPETSPVYCQADGSMLLTREEKWKEIKVGRIFPGSSNINEISKNRGIITESAYCAHLGNSDDFWERFSKEIPHGRDLIFICDGAKWLWNYIDTHYPGSVQILDYFHCKEHICSFAKDYFGKNTNQAEAFVTEVMDCFMDKKVLIGIQKIRSLKTKKKKIAEHKIKLINYLTNNIKRINYGKFKEKGYLIGSGAIEAAHRNVIQKRLKLSGQRWTKAGAQQIANLRVCEKSNQWNQVVELITNSNLAA